MYCIYILLISQLRMLGGLGHGGKEGGPQRAALVADLAATHRVAAGAREARARVTSVTGVLFLF